jgi:hypothetical protein
LEVLGQGDELLCQFMCGLQLPPHRIRPPQSQQRRDELRGFPHLPAHLKGPIVGMSHFQSPIAFHRYQGRAQGDVQQEFLPSALGGYPGGF